jgi:hypothetical protein
MNRARASIVTAAFSGRPAPWTSRDVAGLDGAEAKAAVSGDVPPFVKDEFDAFPERGIPAQGSPRLHSRIVSGRWYRWRSR